MLIHRCGEGLLPPRSKYSAIRCFDSGVVGGYERAVIDVGPLDSGGDCPHG